MKNKQVITKNNILSENTTIRAGPIMLNDSSHSTAHEAEKRLKLYIYLFQIQVVYWADTSYDRLLDPDRYKSYTELIPRMIDY
jgi:hypothetical protein